MRLGAGAVVAAGEIEVDGPRCDHDVMMHVVMMTDGHMSLTESNTRMLLIMQKKEL